jgi:hypothetical protein
LDAASFTLAARGSAVACLDQVGNSGFCSSREPKRPNDNWKGNGHRNPEHQKKLFWKGLQDPGISVSGGKEDCSACERAIKNNSFRFDESSVYRALEATSSLDRTKEAEARNALRLNLYLSAV